MSGIEMAVVIVLILVVLYYFYGVYSYANYEGFNNGVVVNRQFRDGRLPFKYSPKMFLNDVALTQKPFRYVGRLRGQVYYDPTTALQGPVDKDRDFMEGTWTDGERIFSFQRTWQSRASRIKNSGFDQGPNDFYDAYRPLDLSGALVGGVPPSYVYYTQGYGNRTLPLIRNGDNFKLGVTSTCCNGKKVDNSILFEDGRIFRKMGLLQKTAKR
tara:strand:- start:1654 stop:2292 length:639 start_codon:yes stop_codon:yes gene_type:complete